ncbi:hypothetical protein BE08_02375 [Sorangium cellulosum]|uniref:Uncharacterized protein n=1 Tax=Sorangium cellulosum TaxID=56 RepID=A0A150P493_SORCE|nr:hypothetical protein BE08_02375 [Sorangium cellulosum]
MPAKELDEESGFAICPGCGAVLEIPDADLDDARDDLPGLESHGRMSMPPSHSVSFTEILPEEYRGHIRRKLVMSWPLEDIRPGRTSLLLITLFMWSCGYITLSATRDAEPAILAISIAIIGPLAIGVTYLLLASLLNRTHLTITGHELQVRHGPLPWPGNTSLPVDSIEQLYCARKISGRHKEFVSFSLNARLRSGETRPVVSRLRRPTTAMYLKQCAQKAFEPR